MKQCIRCKKIKPTKDFTPRKERPGQFTVDCKKCRSQKSKIYRIKNYSNVRKIEKNFYKNHRKERVAASIKYGKAMRAKDKNYERRYKLKYTYGITIEEFDQILKDQGDMCAICKTNKPSGRGFGIDHCHKTGKIRGILCHSCNTALGGFKDSPELLEKAINYLARKD